MADTILEQRVTNLEELMADLIATVDRVDRQIERTDRQIERTDGQLGELATQLLLNVDRLDQQFERTDRQLDRVGRQMEQMQRQSARLESQMNKRWGDLANKMGTLVEDLVAPSIPFVLRTAVGCPENAVDSFAVRVRRLHPVTRQQQEFDVVAACGGYVLINETKSSLDAKDIRAFAERLPEAREFFPEYTGKQFVGAIASLYVDESVVRFAERQGLIILGFAEGVMEVLNSAGFEPKLF